MNRLESPFIGTLIKYPELIDKYGSYIVSDDFFEHQSNIAIWKAIKSLISNGIEIDKQLIAHSCGELASVEYIEKAISISNKDNIHNYAKVLFDSYIKRLLRSKMADILSKEKTISNDSMLLEISDTANSLNDLNPETDNSGISIVPKVSARMKSGANIIKYGLEYLDKIAGGGTRGEMMAVAARPGHGKTTLSANIIKALTEQGLKGIVFNREMSNEEFYKKLFILESELLDTDMLRKKDVSEKVIKEIEKLTPILQEKYKNLYTYDNLRDAESAAAEVNRRKPDYFIDDFIQMVQSDGDDRKDKVRSIFSAYSNVCKRTNAHGIIISQMNREIEKRVSLEPVLSDFADASEIEWFCETAIFLQHPYKYNWKKFPETDLNLFCLKSRYGKVQTMTLHFDGRKCLIANP